MPRRSAAVAPAPPEIRISAVQPELPPVEKKIEDERPATWFWDRVAAISDSEWGNVYDLILMRRGESKVPYAAGMKGFLDLFTKPVNLAFIKNTYGGGLYTIVLEKNSRYETTHNFEIEGAAKYDERRERPTNAAAQSADGNAGVMQQFISVLREELERSRSNGGNSGAADAAVEMLTNASKKAMEIVEKQAVPGSDPTAQLVSLVTVAKQLGLGAAPASSGGMNEIFVAMLPKIVERLFAPPPNPLEQITMFLGVFDKIDALRGGGGDGKPRDWKAMAVEKGLEAIPAVLDAINQRSAATAAQQQQRPTQRFIPADNRAPQPVPAGAAVAPGSHAAPSPQPVPAPAGPLRVVALDGTDGTFPQAGSGLQPGDDIQSAQAAPPPVMIGDRVPTPEEARNQWVKKQIVEFVMMDMDGEALVDFLEGASPAVLEDIQKYTDAMVESFFAGDPILVHAVQHPRWKGMLAEVRECLKEPENVPA